MGLLTNLALFAGAGGLELGARKCGGFRTIGYVEKDRYAQGVIMSRIRGGELDDGPIWDDVTTFDGRPWRGLVDVVSGGFPCQDISLSGNMLGIEDGAKSGLWREFRRTISEVGPGYILVENVPGDLRWINRVRRDLRELGYVGRTIPLSACAFGAPFPRERVFVVAHTTGERREMRWQIRKESQHTPRRNRIQNKTWDTSREENASSSTLDGISHGLAFRLDRIRCCGNGVVPDQSIPAWSLIKRLAGEIE